MKYYLMTLFALTFTSIVTIGAEPARARLMYNDASNDDVIVISYKDGAVTYKLNPRDLNRKIVRAPKLEAIYFYEPKIYKEAMNLYNGRKYKEAREKFAECEKVFRSMDTAPNNFSSLAGFYKLECSRRLFDFDTLSQDLEKFLKTGLTRETHLQQLEVYKFWEAVRFKEWDRLDRLAQAWSKRKVTGGQRAQIAYCHGLALEQLAKKDPSLISKALNAYNMAVSADFSHSMEIVSSAASHALAMYNSDPEVDLAIKLWKTEDENLGSIGHQRLLEAHSLVKLYQLGGFEKHKPLKDAYKRFLQYAPVKETL